MCLKPIFAYRERSLASEFVPATPEEPFNHRCKQHLGGSNKFMGKIKDQCLLYCNYTITGPSQHM